MKFFLYIRFSRIYILSEDYYENKYYTSLHC